MLDCRIFNFSQIKVNILNECEDNERETRMIASEENETLSNVSQKENFVNTRSQRLRKESICDCGYADFEANSVNIIYLKS
ncbi:hypothetical protein KIN20_019894 [Parelaphostrongylus tenuis]|uniref:Uncharacterized protein n=1 Tax=Parelaphostrongylus tenuis TaxID=148309 RepID=A0AAD5MLT2_PARTN|nr:hypothetical protein KIN20_019894 [Parelaphostrongylus tenuis]